MLPLGSVAAWEFGAGCMMCVAERRAQDESIGALPQEPHSACASSAVDSKSPKEGALRLTDNSRQGEYAHPTERAQAHDRRADRGTACTKTLRNCAYGSRDRKYSLNPFAKTLRDSLQNARQDSMQHAAAPCRSLRQTFSLRSSSIFVQRSRRTRSPGSARAFHCQVGAGCVLA